MWEKLAEAEHLIERRGRRRQAAFRFGQELSLAVDHLHSEATRVGMAVHEGDALREGVVFHHRVGVEEQDILARRLPDGLVVGLCKAHIVLVGDDFHLGKLLRQHLQRAVYGVVIDNKHLALDALHSATHRVQALFEEVLDVIVDDDDRELHALHHFGAEYESWLTLMAWKWGPSYSGMLSPMFSKPQAFMILPLRSRFCIHPVNRSAPGP